MPNAFLKIKPYNNRTLTEGHQARLKELIREKIIGSYPRQIERTDLVYDEGIDVVYEFTNLTPKKFQSNVDRILAVARDECRRYQKKGSQRTFFTTFTVRVNTKGPRGGSKVITRTYPAAKHIDPDIMVFGTGTPTVENPPFLINQADRILRMVHEYKPGVALQPQTPFRVLRMIVSIRAGLQQEKREADIAKLTKKREEEGMV